MKLTRLTLPPALAGILAVIRLLPRVSRGRTVLLALGVVVAALLPLGFMIVTGLLVGSIPTAVRGGLDSPAGGHTLMLLAGATVLIVAQRVLGPLEVALGTVFGREIDRYLQERTMAAVGRPTGIGHLEDPTVLNLIESAQGIGSQGFRPGDAVASLASLLPDWLGALGSAIILATFRWWLGLAWIVLWPVLLYYLQREYIRVGEVASAEASAVRRADYYRDLTLRPTAAKEVRIWGLVEWLESRFETSWQRVMMPIWQARRPGRAVLWTTTGIVAAGSFATFWLLARSAVNGEIALGALALYVQAAVGVTRFRAFDDANMVLAYAAVSVPSLRRLEERLDGGEVQGTLSLAPDSPHSEIRFEGVGFRYPGQTADALADLDLTIPAGRSLAIVGANGAGKTTLVKLLCRLYEPTAGRITVDGVDLRDVEPGDWRQHVAAIFQDFARYHLSARDNVAMGGASSPGPFSLGREKGSLLCSLGREKGSLLYSLQRAAERAGALEIIESLPHDWDTILSRQYSGGVDLSGGQWQRIALARALFAVEGGARVLILDEPTANLDVRAEAEIYDRFLEITAGLTTILISHRFSTVRRAHQIVVLDGGRIVERGSHDELMDLDGEYAHMFRLQAERFGAGVSQEGE